MTLAHFTGLRRTTRCALAAAAAALAFFLPAHARPEAPAARGAPLRIGVIGPFSGASADFGLPMLNGIMHEQPFSAQDKEATTQNMLVMGMVKNGAVTFAYAEDARRNLFVQRKQ